MESLLPQLVGQTKDPDGIGGIGAIVFDSNKEFQSLYLKRFIIFYIFKENKKVFKNITLRVFFCGT
jgi:hypothetical protein